MYYYKFHMMYYTILCYVIFIQYYIILWDIVLYCAFVFVVLCLYFHCLTLLCYTDKLHIQSSRANLMNLRNYTCK
jgi:hypothetical protein